MHSIRSIRAFALTSPLLLLAGCGGGTSDPAPNTSFTSAGDAAVLASVTGTYTGMTAQGPVTLTICEDVADETANNVFTDFEIFDDDTCVAHNVLGDGRGETEEVALGPVTYHHDVSLDPSEPSDVSCNAVAGTPVSASLSIGACAAYTLHGALVVTKGPESDPYAPPFTLSLQLDDVHTEKLAGQMTALGSVETTYSDDLSCLSNGTGVSVVTSLQRTGADGCAAH